MDVKDWKKKIGILENRPEQIKTGPILGLNKSGARLMNKNILIIVELSIFNFF